MHAGQQPTLRQHVSHGVCIDVSERVGVSRIDAVESAARETEAFEEFRIGVAGELTPHLGEYGLVLFPRNVSGRFRVAKQEWLSPTLDRMGWPSGQTSAIAAMETFSPGMRAGSLAP